MLDHVSISHASGLVLWSKSFNPTFKSLASAPNSPINALVKDIMIENKASVKGEEDGMEKDGFSVRWTVENGLGLVFVVVFPALLPLTYVPAFLLRVKQLFLSLFQPYVQALVDSLSATSTAVKSSTGSALAALQSQLKLQKWEAIFDRCLRAYEDRSLNSSRRTTAKTSIPLSRKAQISAAAALSDSTTSPSTSADEQTPTLTAEEIAKNVQALKSRKKGAKGGKNAAGGSEKASPNRPNTRSSAAAKVMRKWNDGNLPVTDADMAELDFSGDQGSPSGVTSADSSIPGTPIDVDSLVSSTAMGSVGKDGLYEVADWDAGRESTSGDLPTEEEILARGKLNKSLANMSLDDDPDSKPEAAKPVSALSNLFSRFTGSKILTDDDLKPILSEMEKHLMDKNVAKEIAEKICENVGLALKGKKIGGFSSIKAEVQSAMSDALTRVLTSKSSTDILLDIKRKAALSAPISAAGGPALKNPYTITFIGVNGVGKSTNLSKVCFWLLQNKMRVLIAACDTFRSGAVEQLRIHVRNLGALEQQAGQGIGEPSRIELFERGYGRDAAGIAKEAIAYAKENQFDVVLIDTAGRMQDNEPLMRSLAKLVSVNEPDKIVFVGEALVGNEAVDQLSKFDKALKDFTAAASSGGGGGRGGDKGKSQQHSAATKVNKARGIDGMILTKFDTIDDKVGAALSMTYITGQPIFFVGCGQTYTDLRHLKVNHIVQALLSN